MKTRNILPALGIASMLTWALVSCNLAGVSIDQRVSDFQADLNTSTRSSAYQNFDPNMQDYGLLMNGGYFITQFPTTSLNYSLSVINESNTTAVLVQVTSGPNNVGGAYNPPNAFLLLNMTKNSNNEWLISALSVGGSSSGPWTTPYQ